MLTKDCSSYTLYLAWLQSSTRELQGLEYLKSVFLEVPNVTTLLVFQNQVTYDSTVAPTDTSSKLTIQHS